MAPNIKATALSSTFLKDSRRNSGECGDSVHIAGSTILEVEWYETIGDHIYLILDSGDRWWAYAPDWSIEGTEEGNNPKSAPLNAEELPPVPEPEFEFTVPGISATLNPSSRIWHEGKETNFTWGEAVIGDDGSFRRPENAAITQNIIRCAGYMQGVREYLGDRPIGVTSWYRDPATNRKWGGARFSTHMDGYAVDWYVVGENVADTFRKMKSYIINDGGLAVGNGFVHLDLRGYASRWTYPDGPRVALW